MKNANKYVKNQEFFMVYYKTLCEKHPEFIVRAFQLALEVYYNKRRFSEQEICNIFEHKFSLEDFARFNKGITDTSTFFSALQTNHLYTQPGFIKNVDTCLVIAPALDSSVLKELPPEFLERMLRINKATGNTINDVDLNGHHYDYKITPDPYYGRNHIMFITVNQNNQFRVTSTRIAHYMDQQVKLIDKNSHSSFSQMNERNYYIKFIDVLNAIQNESASDIEKYYRLNQIIFQDLHNRPATVYIPLFIPVTSKPYNPNPVLSEEIKKIDLQSTKVLQASHIRKALLSIPCIRLSLYSTSSKSKTLLGSD